MLFSYLNVYYNPHFHSSVVNYSLGCKEVYTDFFPPEADGPKKCIARLYLDSFGQHSCLKKIVRMWLLPSALLRQKIFGCL